MVRLLAPGDTSFGFDSSWALMSHAFYIRKGNRIKLPVNYRIIIDVTYILEINPNYIRLRINKLKYKNLLNNASNFFENND